MSAWFLSSLAAIPSVVHHALGTSCSRGWTLERFGCCREPQQLSIRAPKSHPKKPLPQIIAFVARHLLRNCGSHLIWSAWVGQKYIQLWKSTNGNKMVKNCSVRWQNKGFKPFLQQLKASEPLILVPLKCAILALLVTALLHQIWNWSELCLSLTMFHTHPVWVLIITATLATS